MPSMRKVVSLVKHWHHGGVEDDPEIYHGAPVGVQIVARKYEEEKVWAIAKIISTTLLAAQKEMELS